MKLVFLFPVILFAAPMTMVAEGRGLEIFFDKAEADIFPSTWLKPGINAKAVPLAEKDKQPSQDLLTTALAKYPAKVLSANLHKIYVVGGLEYSGVPAGGTNSRSTVYLVNRGTVPGVTTRRIFHAEFSSILLRNFPSYLDKTKWLELNPDGFRYRGSGVQAIYDRQASVRFDAALHEEGFLNEYGKASLEEDFNSLAGRLLVGDVSLWRVIALYPKVREKANLVMTFYEKLDPAFTKDFFLALRRAEVD